MSDLPPFLREAGVTCEKYRKWLNQKAAALVRRDIKRGNTTATRPAYKAAIHEAVCRWKGRDAYTGEALKWSLIGTYENAKSKDGRRDYKAGFALLPTVDHVDDGLGAANFEICGWRSNDAKNDLTHNQFVELCRNVCAHADRAR
jgi:hypothetical protein